RLMMTIEESRDAIKTPSVVLESAVHLYVSREPIADDPVCDGRLEPISVCVGREQDNPRATHESRSSCVIRTRAPDQDLPPVHWRGLPGGRRRRGLNSPRVPWTPSLKCSFGIRGAVWHLCSARCPSRPRRPPHCGDALQSTYCFFHSVERFLYSRVHAIVLMRAMRFRSSPFLYGGYAN